MSWPTEWKQKNPPQFPVVKEISRDKEGILYTVVVSDGSPVYEGNEDQFIVWDQFVEFTPLNHSGGPAFQGAAQEQERVAEAWVEAIERGGVEYVCIVENCGNKAYTKNGECGCHDPDEVEFERED